MHNKVIRLPRYSQLTRTENRSPKGSFTSSQKANRLSSSCLSSGYGLSLFSQENEASCHSAAEERISEIHNRSPLFSLDSIRIFPDRDQLREHINPGWMPQAKSPKIYPLQAKLAINQPGDRYEEEADRVAEQVVHMPDPGTFKGPVLSQPPSIQRSCPKCKKAGEREEDEERLQMKPLHTLAKGAAQSIPASVPPIVHEVLRTPGQPLDASTRAFMEPRFRNDFSNVRVHTDARAAESARAMNALAYTVGQNMVFGTGQYAPRACFGRTLIAHELAHTIQSSAPFTCNRLEIGPPHSPHEQQAEEAVHSISAAHAVVPASLKAGVIQRMTREQALDLARSLDTRYPNWLNVLPPCPCTFAEASASSDWMHSIAHDLTLPWFHPGAKKQVRSARGYPSIPGSSHGQQCCYDSNGNLITEGAGAGTPDLWSPITNSREHQDYDVAAFNQLGWRIYDLYWRPNNGMGCRPNAGGGTRMSSGRYRIVGAFDEIDLFLISIVRRRVDASEDVRVTATGREQGGLVGGHGHYSRIEVIPANQAATNLFGGNQPRYVPSYILQPL